jgi:hypothetical protein
VVQWWLSVHSPISDKRPSDLTGDSDKGGKKWRFSFFPPFINQNRRISHHDILPVLPHVPPVHKVAVETSSSLHSLRWYISNIGITLPFLRILQSRRISNLRRKFLWNSFVADLTRCTWPSGHTFKSVYTRSVNVACTRILRPHTLVVTILRSSNLLMDVVLRYYYYWSGHRCSSGVPSGLMRSHSLVL